jgi:ABC-type amino acid transport substrate-binding protein
MKKAISCIIAIIILVCSLTVSISAEKQKLVIGVTDFQPFNYYDENGILTGFDTELAYYICEKLNMEPEFVEIEWDEKLLMLNSGAIDCVWNDLVYTSERAYEMSLSDVYLTYHYYSEDDNEQIIENSVIGFKKGNSIVNQVNRFLTEAKNDGTIARLAAKYNINTTNNLVIPEKQKLVIGITDYQPFNYYDENGLLTGFDTELAYYVCEKLNMEPEFVEIEWDEKLLMLNSGAIDCVWNDMAYTSERAYEMSLSDVYLM